MSKKMDRDYIVVLDIGTSKITCIVAEINDSFGTTGETSTDFNIIGMGSSASAGLSRGEVVNIEATVKSIQRAVEEAESMSGCQVNSVYTSISGSHVKSLNSHGIVAIRDSEVTRADVERVIDAARAVAIPADQQVLHILPQEFVIDRQARIHEPVGMSGVRLEAKVHLITGSVSSAQNIVKCVKRCGLTVEDMVFEPLAASYAALTNDEKDLGVCLVDIGAGTTGISVFHGGAIRHTAIFPIGGNQVTNDIAVALRIPTQLAESVKVNHACAMRDYANSSKRIQLPGSADRRTREVSQAALTDVIEARYEELLTLIQAEVRKSGFEELIPAGVVFTGGGVKVAHFAELADRVFRMPVRIGTNANFTGPEILRNNPMFTTSLGLLEYAKAQRDQGVSRRRRFNTAGVKGTIGRVKSWLVGNF